jgi:hypothetical protein
VNLNNREPLIAPDYDLAMLLDLSTVVEELGFDSVWVGDSLFSKPRWEPISLLSAISQRTSRVKLGTACMVSSTRNPLYLALEWATLDAISGGRTILGTGMGNPEEGVRREIEALGLDYSKRAAIFDEGLEAIRQLWTKGSVTLHGAHFTYDDVSFFSGTEQGPLMPAQAPPPIWVVSNPRLKGDAPPDVMERRMRAACRRIVTWGDGWMTCCRAQHPEELVDQLDVLLGLPVLGQEADRVGGVGVHDHRAHAVAHRLQAAQDRGELGDVVGAGAEVLADLEADGAVDDHHAEPRGPRVPAAAAVEPLHVTDVPDEPAHSGTSSLSTSRASVIAPIPSLTRPAPGRRRCSR